MNKTLFALSALASLAPAPLTAQSFHSITKYQNFLQRSAAAPVAHPIAPFTFSARSAAGATLTLPGGANLPLIRSPWDDGYELDRSFATRAALDAAFPNGSYRLAGGGLSAVTINLTGDSYPAVVPQVTSVVNGTWSNGGVLVVDPAQPVTLNFNTFTDYATNGLGGHLGVYVSGLSDTVETETNVISQPLPGLPVSPTPLTSHTIPARTFTSGRVYAVRITFETIVAADLSNLAGGIAAGLYSRELLLHIGALSPGASAPPAPVIAGPPASQVGVAGGNVTFTVTGNFGPESAVAGTLFDWTRNGQPLGDPQTSGGKYSSTGPQLTINRLTADDAGDYAVMIVNPSGFTVSSAATLTLAGARAPQITAQPRGATVNAGSTVALTVTATGSPTPAYQWRKDDVALAGATTDTLMLPAVGPAAAGRYTVVVSNSSGTVVSDAAVLAVTSGQPSRLPNLSVRTSLTTGQMLTVGFATTGAKTMLVRGVGPTLAEFGLSGFLPDPMIELFGSGAVKIDENNDWNPALAPVFAAVGAFPLAAASRDAALRRDCSGAYTAQIKSTGAGVVLVEVYDTGGTGKLTNVSARNRVGTGDNILIAGFVVDGSAAKTLLLRAVGPKLAEFGVDGVLADPRLEIYSGANKIAENDNWSALLQPVARSVGAFDLTLGSRDAALLITLPPGGYTAQISGVAGGTGEAIVEVYEVP